MSADKGIRIVIVGSEVYAFDTILWPSEVSMYPVVYTAWSMVEHSYDSKRIGWKWIRKDQFDWLVKHHDCLVSYTGVESKMPFYCHNHNCWEKDGKDWVALEMVPIENYIESDFDEERKV